MCNRIALTVLALCLAACGGSDSTAPTGPPKVAGTYELQTVNGNPLPALFYSDSVGEIDALNDELSLSADHTWTESGTVRVSIYATGAVSTQPLIDNGTYTQNNTTILFSSTPSGGYFDAVVSGATLTVVGHGSNLVYHRM